MPGSMVHLLVAQLLPDGREPLFLLGSIAPDAIAQRPGATREEKDRMHFRTQNRWALLRSLAENASEDDPFSKGYLLHLYTDALWDEGPQADYKVRFPSDNWIVPYRKELGLCGSWLFQHAEWSKDVWAALLSVTAVDCSIGGCPSCSEILAFRDSIYHTHKNRDSGPSAIFSPELVDRFAVETVHAYLKWLQKIKKMEGER